MSTRLSAFLFAGALAVCACGMSPAAYAQQVTVVGPITEIQMAGDGRSATAVLKESKSGAAVRILVTDEETLSKFKDKRIVVGDEVRARFESGDGRNLSKTFRKTAGC